MASTIMTRYSHLSILFGATIVCTGGCTSEPQAPAPAPAPTRQQAAKVEPAPQEPATVEPQAAVPIESQPPVARRDDEVEQAVQTEPVKEAAPRQQTAFFRLDANAPAAIPPVLLTKAHQALCKVKVGDILPAIELPDLGGSTKRLADLYGQKATVVVFWKGDRRMAQIELADLGPDVIDVFGREGVAVVGIAVDETAATAQAAVKKSGVKFPTLLDAGGQAFAQVGTAKLPRTYLVDPQGKILWFDIEYSLSTRRDLHRALHAVTGAPPEAVAPAPATGKQG
jgi:peroxiredoxin